MPLQLSCSLSIIITVLLLVNSRIDKNCQIGDIHHPFLSKFEFRKTQYKIIHFLLIEVNICNHSLKSKEADPLISPLHGHYNNTIVLGFILISDKQGGISK